MHFFVVGATGRTGRALVTQALERGHSVTAFGRSRYAGQAYERLRIVTGSPLDGDDIAAALPDHDAVLSALGTRGLGATSLLADSARAVVEAMRRTGVQRLIVLGSSLTDDRLPLVGRLLSRTILRHHAHDQRAMEQVVRRSGVEWTIVRPARLTDGPLTRRYFFTAAGEPGRASHLPMSRNDAAHFMLDAAERGEYAGQIVWLRGAR